MVAFSVTVWPVLIITSSFESGILSGSVPEVIVHVARAPFQLPVALETKVAAFKLFKPIKNSAHNV